MSRKATIQRKTAETQVLVELDLEGTGTSQVSTGVGFLDHMLELFSHHSLIDISVQVEGDLAVDDHHSVEDVGIVLGQSLKEALGEKVGIARFGSVLLPMDEVLVAVALDLSGRITFRSDYQPVRERVGDLSCEMVNHFFSSVAANCQMCLHFRFMDRGSNEHHRIEAMFKGFAQALRQAVQIDERRDSRVLSTKGVL